MPEKKSNDTFEWNWLENLDSGILFYKDNIMPSDTVFSAGFSVFRPKLLANHGDSTNCRINLTKMITSNIVSGSDSLEWNNVPDTIIVLSDSTKIGLFGIVTPDLPVLFPTDSKNAALRFDIFKCTEEILKEFEQNDVEIIIAINYLDEYLNYELLQSFPEIDYIFDSFQMGKNDYSERRILKKKLKNLNFSDFLLKQYIIYYSLKPTFNIDSLKVYSRD